MQYSIISATRQQVEAVGAVDMVARALTTMLVVKFLLNDIPHAAGMAQNGNAELKQRVSRYYSESYPDYKKFWETSETLSLHYGYHKHPGTPHAVAVIDMIKKLTTTAHITSSDYVLDAGCGVGGSSNWLAENIGCRVVGIDITESQLGRARQHAYSGVEFFNMDFCNTTFFDNTFDVVWALESSCHAQNKMDFIREAYRILKVGGRLAVADGFGVEPDMKILQGWAVPNLAGVDQFMGQLLNAGFKNIGFEDITKNVLPSSRRMYRAAMSVYPIHKASKYLHFRTQVQYGNVETAIEQYDLLTKGKFKYCIFVGEK